MGTMKHFDPNLQEWVRTKSGAITDGIETLDIARFKEVENTLSDQAYQEALLVHGQNIITSDQPSPMNVEFYGTSRVNLLGKIGNFEDLSKWSGDTTGFSLDTSNYKYGSNSLKLTLTSANYKKYKDLTGLDASKYYIVAVDINVSSYTSGYFGFGVYDNGGYLNGVTSWDVTSVTNGWVTKYVKFTGKSGVRIAVGTGGSSTGTVNFDGARLISVSSDTYNKIGVSLTDEDVERMFPYVDGIKPVKNPVLKVEGTQLLGGSPDSLHANAKVVVPYELELVATASGQISSFTINVVDGQTYTFSIPEIPTNGLVYMKSTDNSGTLVYDSRTHGNTKSITVSGYTKLFVGFSCTSSGTFNYKNWMLNLGTTALPFVEKNDSYVYVETSLYGNDNKKDILTRNYDLNRWEVKREFNGRSLTGDDDWVYSVDKTGFKIVKTLLDNPANNGNAQKYDGSIINHAPTWSDIGIDTFSIAGDGNVGIGVSDADSGWGEDYTPTSAEMSANFYNWRLCDGTYGTPYNGTGTKTWYPKGDSDLTRSTTTVPTSNAPTIAEGVNENYFLLYQLSKSVVEPVTVEGSLSISGDAQVEVSEGVIVREEVVPVLDGDYYYINNVYGSRVSAKLDYKLAEFIEIYRKNDADKKNWSILTHADAYGNYFARIHKDNYNGTDPIHVTYELLDKHAFTTNLNEVKATYSNSLKSSFDRTLEQVSDNTTKLSIHERLKANKAQEQWINATLQNGWVNHSTDNKAMYFKDEFSEVKISGWIKNGTTSAWTHLLKLPKGYRPKKNMRYIASCSDGTNYVPAYIQINSDGTVQTYQALSGNTFLSLDNISFRAEQ